MGGSKSKEPRKPDLNEVLINMKMKAKTFQRESQKAAKEKNTYYKRAKTALKQGNEEGARLFLESAQQKDSESMKYLKIANRLEALSGKVGASFKSQDMMNNLSSMIPFLEDSAQKLPLDVMYNQMNSFENAYDKLVIKGQMVDDTIENTMGEKGTVSNTDKMMNQLKAEVGLDMGVEYIPNSQQQQQVQQNNAFYDDLKKI